MTEQRTLSEEKEAIKVICQNELVPFAGFINTRYEPNWHHWEIADKLEKVERGEIKRLMIFMPPRHGKSELASTLFPSWYLGRHPEKEIIVSSYSAELAQDFGYKTRNYVNSQEYQEIFKTKLRDDSKGKAKWLTQEGGGYTSVGVGGAVTGRGADILLIDDPIKNREEAESKTIRDKVWNWYTSTAYTRLEKGGAVILIQTRWHKDDLAGRLLNNIDEGDDWDILDLPAIAIQDEPKRKLGEPLWESKYDAPALEKIKKTIGIYDWNALYQQKPLASETQEFKEEYWKYRTMEEVESIQTRRYLTIDTAISQKASADYTGFCLNFVDANNSWNIKAWKKKLGPLELIDDLFTLWETYRLNRIGIEKTIYLQVIKPFIDQEMRVRNKFLNIVELDHNQTQKEVRIRSILPRYQSGSVYHIKGHCSDLESEQVDFPQGVHDDVLDAEAYQTQIADNRINRPKKRRPIRNKQGIGLRMTNY